MRLEKKHKVLGIPAEELEVRMRTEMRKTKGPDFYVYHKGKLTAIGDVKSTTNPNEFPNALWKDAIEESFKGKYFTDEKWKDQFKNVKYGIPVAAFIKVNALPKALVEKNLEGTIDVAVGPAFYENPSYQP